MTFHGKQHLDPSLAFTHFWSRMPCLPMLTYQDTDIKAVLYLFNSPFQIWGIIGIRTHHATLINTAWASHMAVVDIQWCGTAT